jgi:hypothetical protein
MVESSKQAAWAGRMASWERSGLSRRAWCDRHDVNVHTFDYWRRRLREAPVLRKRKARTSLVPIVVAAAAPVEPLELVLPSGIRLRVPSDANMVWVAGLVRALGTC